MTIEGIGRAAIALPMPEKGTVILTMYSRALA